MRRPAIIAALCLGLALLQGCSVIRLGYGQAESLAFRWLDGYAEFDDAQSLRVREALGAWFAWHRRSQLPDYAELLTRVDTEVLGDTTPERVCGWWQEVRDRIDRGFDRAVPAATEVAVTLKPAQLQSLEQRYAKSNAEFRDDVVQVEPAKRIRDTAKRIAGRAEWLYGDLDEAQRELVARFVAESPYDPALAYDERLKRQDESLRTLRRLAGQGTAAAQVEVRDWLRHLLQSPRAAYRQQSERIVQHNCKLAAALHNGTTPAQRQVASKKLKGWATELRAMGADAGA